MQCFKTFICTMRADKAMKSGPRFLALHMMDGAIPTKGKRSLVMRVATQKVARTSLRLAFGMKKRKEQVHFDKDESRS